jgi:hypothetical protein
LPLRTLGYVAPLLSATLYQGNPDSNHKLWNIVKLMVWISLFMVFNNISVISWWSVLLVEESGENHWPVVSHWQILSHNVVCSTPCHEQGLNSQLLVVIGTDFTGSCKSNYHTITTTTTPHLNWEMYAMYSICRCWWNVAI